MLGGTFDSQVSTTWIRTWTEASFSLRRSSVWSERGPCIRVASSCGWILKRRASRWIEGIAFEPVHLKLFRHLLEDSIPKGNKESVRWGIWPCKKNILHQHGMFGVFVVVPCYSPIATKQRGPTGSSRNTANVFIPPVCLFLCSSLAISRSTS